MNGHGDSFLDDSKLRELIDKFSDFSDFAITIGANMSQSSKAIIILTGSIGSLGSYLLDTILQSDQIQEVWCLNRSVDSKTQQEKSNI